MRKTSNSRKNRVKLVLNTVLIVCIAILLSAAALFAAQTRGLVITARDAASGQQKEVKLYNRSYAVIIGIDQYQNLPMDRQLTYAVRDAKGIQKVLEKNFKFDKIIPLYNKDATKDNILKVLMGDLAKEMTEEDSLFIFWAGHGNQEKTREGDLGYLIPYDGSMTEVYKNITMAQIRDDISKKIPAKHIFYVMDACYGGMLAETRAGDKQTKRDFAYLQDITKERVRQVLTAGGKDQEVLDGGPKGHSVFTGRLIEELENAEDFVTANELQSRVKEKVFSDARARNHAQTPSFGPLYGRGDFVFVPSIEQKVEDTQAKIADMQREIEKLKTTEEAAVKAQDERAQRQLKIEKNALEAKLKAEQLRQQTLEEEKRKKELAEQERRREDAELVQKKKADEERLAALKKDVEEKRKTMTDKALSSLSPDTAMMDMQQTEKRIFEIRTQFRKELAIGIKSIVDRFNERFIRLASVKQDEFESAQEFSARVAREQSKLNSEQAGDFTAYQDRLNGEYKQQIVPLIENLKKSATSEFTLLAENLTLELGTFDAVNNAYPITIKSQKPVNGLMIAASSSVPMPREEAREFKQHYQNNMLRPEIRGKFESPEVFVIAQASVTDDATSKKYDLFSARLVDLGNGTLYDTRTKLIWSKKGNENDISWNNAQDYLKRLNGQAYLGFRDWRMPSKEELKSLVSYAQSNGYGSGGRTIADFLNKEGFSNIQEKWYWTSTLKDSSRAWFIYLKDGTEGTYDLDYSGLTRVLPVRSGR